MCVFMIVLVCVCVCVDDPRPHSRSPPYSQSARIKQRHGLRPAAPADDYARETKEYNTVCVCRCFVCIAHTVLLETDNPFVRKRQAKDEKPNKCVSFPCSPLRSEADARRARQQMSVRGSRTGSCPTTRTGAPASETRLVCELAHA
jgi:hypothetical protein